MKKVIEMIIGSHVNFTKDQLYGATMHALSFGATTFMFYTGAPQNTVRSKIDEKKTKAAWELMKKGGIKLENVVCHAPYIINLANKEKLDSWNFSIEFLQNEMKRVEELGVKYIVVHPGNYLKLDVSEALCNISEALNEILSIENNVIILLETMAGKGTECGRNIVELKTILAKVERKEKVGICLDTCHLNDSGIDIGSFDEYLNLLDGEVGLEKVKCVHINDSKNILGSHKDRHENLGYGTIGFDNLIKVIYNYRLKDVPKILETPWIDAYPPYKIEIDMIKNKKFNPNLEKDVKDLYNKEPNF